MRRRHPDARVADPAASTSAGQPAGLRPSPTASSAPVSDRTMLWQNASATTVATARRPELSLAQVSSEQRAHRGGALAAAAERREVMLAQAARRRPRSSAPTSSSRGCHSVSCAAQRIGGRGIVADPVGVAPPQRREPRVEPAGAGPDRVDPHVRRQQPGQPPSTPAPAEQLIAQPPVSGDVEWATWPRACTPVSVRPATVSRGGRQAAQRPARARSTSSWTVRRPGWRAQPWKPAPS